MAHDYADGTYEEYDIEDRVKLDAENVIRRSKGEEYGVEVPLIEVRKGIY